MVNDLKNSKKVVGLKQSIKAVEKGIAHTVFIAEDADERVVGKLKDMCTKYNISIVYVDNMKVLGKACDIDVEAAVACIVR